MLRPLPILLAAAALAAAEPLALAGDEQAIVAHALVRLGAGDAGPFAALPPALLAAPVAVADPGQPGRSRRWTQAIPAVLARVPEGERARVLAVLDAAFAAHGGDAADFLPAPAAAAALRRAADAAWDAGRLRDHLGLCDLLGEADVRCAAAGMLLGTAANAQRPAGPPGLPEATDEAPTNRPPGLRVRWTVRPGWLLACDPGDRVRWQLSVPADARALPGDGGCLVHDAGGWRAVLEDGAVRPLPAMPAAVRGLGVAAGFGWFALGSQVWRVPLADGATPRRERLASAPLAAPLAMAGSTLLVDALDAVLVAPDGAVTRTRHGLPVDEGWRLAAGRATPLLLAPDGRRWRLPSLADQFAPAPPAERLRLAVAAARSASAATVLAEHPELAADPALRPLVLRARLLALPPAVDAAWEGLAQGTDRALLAWYAWNLDRSPRHLAVLREGPLPDGGLPADPALAGWPDHAWDHRLGAAGLEAWVSGQPKAPATAATAPLGAPRPRPDAAIDLDCERRLGRTWIRVTIGGVLAWSRTWPSPPLVLAPAMAAAHRGDLVMVCEGHDAAVFDAATGRLLRRAAMDSEPVPDLLRVLDGPDGARLHMLAPPGIGDRLVDERGRSEPLPAPARWCEALPGGGLLMADRSGRGWCRDHAGPWTPCPLPAELATGDPQPLRGGFAVDGRLYPWPGIGP